MEKNKVFTFTAPNGVEVTGVVVTFIAYQQARYNPNLWVASYLVYAQNRLFRCWTNNHFGEENEADFIEFNPESYIVEDYCIIPACDKLIEDYYHKHDVANDYADKTL